jgi:hypothetical protein
MQHFYFAMEDAKEAIKLKPDWAKVIIFISGLQEGIILLALHGH